MELADYHDREQTEARVAYDKCPCCGSRLSYNKICTGCQFDARDIAAKIPKSNYSQAENKKFEKEWRKLLNDE
jgi:hypothetical protein